MKIILSFAILSSVLVFAGVDGVDILPSFKVEFGGAGNGLTLTFDPGSLTGGEITGAVPDQNGKPVPIDPKRVKIKMTKTGVSTDFEVSETSDANLTKIPPRTWKFMLKFRISDTTDKNKDNNPAGTRTDTSGNVKKVTV